MSDTTADPGRELLRHALATLAYRGAKVLRGAPEGFATFAVSPGTRTPAAILAHLGDLLAWGLWMARGEKKWQEEAPGPWAAEVERFFANLAAFAAFLASGEPLAAPVERLFQGPVADALTHVGQLALLRRAAGAPIRGENYFVAEIAAGRLGPDQPPPRREFD
jgi:hypothetical protein